MNTPMPPTIYAGSAYRSTDIPAQPPHKWRQDANRSSLTRIPLHWGNYANLEPWKDVDAQLRPGQTGFLDGRSENDLYINHKRWNFDNTAKLLILHPFLKFSSIVGIPWIFWALSLATPKKTLCQTLLHLSHFQ